MNTFSLDTEDHRCPNVMIMVRRFLTENVKPQALCSIVTREPSAMRDIPFFCQYEDMKLLSKQEINGEYHFSIGHKQSIIETLSVQSSPVEKFDIHNYKLERDAFLHARFRKVVDALKMILDAGNLLSIPSSFGKDSSLTLTAALTAHIECMADPNSPVSKETPFIVVHVDTLVETVVMAMYSAYAMKALREYCQEQGINLELHHVTPPLHEQFASLFIGARKLPSTPSLNADCSVTWKVNLSEGVQKELIKKYGVNRIVSCLGSRDDESASRSASITKFDNRISVETLLERNSSGINTFAPIVDWSTSDVFDCLLRAGEQASIVPAAGFEIPAFMKSYRLLIQLYGDSSSDVCEVVVGSKSNGSGCGGKARNGCHQCFKVGKNDKSATAHNQHLRWSNIQENATKVRDYVFSIAHDIKHRTMHPRTFDHVTNHAMLQPNIIKSKTLEKMLTYYVQLTHEDYLRSVLFGKLVRAGDEMDDPGYSEIANDPDMDKLTKAEFLDMYKHSAQKHLIKVATLEHCIFLSAQWSMDGVKSLPFRPLAIYDAIVNQGKRVQWPTVDKDNIRNDNIPDAVAFRLATPGVDLMSLWKAPHRPWDMFDADHNEGCFTESVPDSIRVSVTYSADKDDVSVNYGGRLLNVGYNVKTQLIEAGRGRIKGVSDITFTQFLTGRNDLEVGSFYADNQRTAKKHAHSTVRKIVRNKKTGAISRTRTSLQMYNPSWKSSLSESIRSSLNVWVPSFAKVSVPIISQHQTDLNVAEPNFCINQEALVDWVQYGGYEEALRVHNKYLNRMRRSHNKIGNRYTVRAFCGTNAFWSLFQSGLISVNNNTWYTCQSTLKRTELFHEIGLFSFVDADRYKNVVSHPKCQTMSMHRHTKAKQLLIVREARNADRKEIKALMALRASDPVMFTVDTVKVLFEEMDSIREQVITPDFISNSMIAASGLAAFDHLEFKRMALVQQDWLDEYGLSMLNVDSFITTLCNAGQKRIIQSNVNAKIALDGYIREKNTHFIDTLHKQLEQWKMFQTKLIALRNHNPIRLSADKGTLKTIDGLVLEYSDSLNHLDYAGHAISRIQTGNKQSLTSLMSGDEKVLSLEWHLPHWENASLKIQSLKDLINSMSVRSQNELVLDNLSPIARAKALIELMKAA